MTGAYVMVIESVLVFPAASLPVTVIVFTPDWRVIVLLQFAVPVMVPVPPALFDHDTRVTPMLSVAVPLMVTDPVGAR